jgi:hypothetical protein
MARIPSYGQIISGQCGFNQATSHPADPITRHRARRERSHPKVVLTAQTNAVALDLLENGIRQERSFADDRRIAYFDPLGKFGSEFSMTGVDIQSGNCAQDSALRNGASYAKRYIKATLSSKVSSWLVLNWTQWPFS